ncbi:Ig-like domain-containing protein [Franconibacter pulveris 1160]|uniref:Ig-like domain-containing protein n=1 Tax=Franconibacter pulveris TaxID=435910 RepID=UPI0004639665|nr:Ig-like domain-containing protein [Franconibacter pulveris]
MNFHFSSQQAAGSLIFYTGKNYAGPGTPVVHGATGQIAANSASWNYQSVAMSGMQSFVFSSVNTGDASVNYLGHIEDIISVNISDLTQLYPSSDQFPLNYLGLDPTTAALVWLEMDAGQPAPNAVASTAQVGGSTTNITTLTLPGRPGALGIVARAEGSAVVANCRYGDYNTSDGIVTWNGTGTVVLEYLGGTVTLISATGFPTGWSFSNPQMQGDGSWVIKLAGGIPDSNIITTITANPGSIIDDGVSASVITATVENGSGQPVAGVTVNWSTTLGSVTPLSSLTGADGTATTSLTDNGVPGTATVTASLDNGSSKSVQVAVTEPAPTVLHVYCSTGAPLNTGMLAAVQPTNKVALYGTPGTMVTLSVTGSAKFKSTNSSSATLTLASDGYGLAEVFNTLSENVTVTATASATSVNATMSFAGTSDKGAVYVNTMTPADNHTPGTFYWWDYEAAGVTAVTLSLTGSAHFADGTQTGIFSLNAKNGAVAINVFDAAAETVIATLTPDSPYYVPSSENMAFISYQPV